MKTITLPRPTNAKEAKELLDAIADAGSGGKYGVLLGIAKAHVNRQAQVAREILSRDDMTGGNVELPDFGDEDIPVEDIISTMKKRNKKRIDHAEAKKWFSIKLKDNKPIAIVFFGDPHLDDDCCNWELLEEHIKLVASHKRIYGINIGDSHNNWAGKLMRIYAEQETSRRTAYKLVKWFLFDSGIKWLVWLLGNHDSWADGIDRMKAMGANAVVMEDWRAQFKLVFPNGTEVLVDAAHDHKGSSEWNELHAQLKVARTERTPHIVVAGHRHTPGLAERYNPHDPSIPKTWLCRLNSYKWKDSHAWQGGFYNHTGPPAMMAVIDPTRPNDPVFMTGDLERGVRELEYLLK